MSENGQPQLLIDHEAPAEQQATLQEFISLSLANPGLMANCMNYWHNYARAVPDLLELLGSDTSEDVSKYLDAFINVRNVMEARADDHLRYDIATEAEIGGDRQVINLLAEQQRIQKLIDSRRKNNKPIPQSLNDEAEFTARRLRTRKIVLGLGRIAAHREQEKEPA